MHLSKRLQMVTDCVTKGSTVADVGCDHAYISIYLIEHGIATKTVALDINKGPLERAAKNVSEYGYEDRIMTRLSNGLEKLEVGEADSIVIAGMGGDLMVRILSERDACVKVAKEVILQPQSEVDKVRRYLHKLEFTIIEENMCIDDGKYYVVIHAVNTNKEQKTKESKEVAEDFSTKVDYSYGPLLLRSKHPILKQYLEKERKTARLIEENLKLHQTKRNELRLKEIQEEIDMLNFALNYYTLDQ